ncbi:integral membrane protein-like protein [Pleomassaria siparia CBS 279.74]|uniref:Integral membrane protein-like protein n=1 Tax=Pleomassaria siparia CBS 279.74 TaxID=1314801 RepID=A0A6G1K788_9PLEO|nr:integral membrane protein-like protein [Pleomassaria siparia CBS 279.74]
MSTSEAQEMVAKERIMKHMNADHQESIRRYIEASEQTSFYQVRDAQMTDINLNNIKISYGGKQAVIPFDPPMKSLREARERLVQMDKDSLQTLGRSDISITKFVQPYAIPAHMMNFTTWLITYTAFSRRSNFMAGSLLYDTLLSRTPGFATFCLTIQPLLLVIIMGAHSVECVLMARKLAKHGLTPFEAVWWLWVGTTFVEGFTASLRLNGLIAEKKKEKEAKKH